MLYRAANKAGKRLRPGGKGSFPARTLAWLRRRPAGVDEATVSKVRPRARDRFLQVVRGEVGVTEHPPGSNTGERVREYQAATTAAGTGWAYCMAGIVWACAQAGIKLGYRGAYVPHFEQWARAAGRWQTERPTLRQVRRHAWAVVFDFDPGDSGVFDGDHVGVLDHERLPFVRWATIEFNTSSGDRGSQANGGGVYQRVRHPSLIRGYVRLT